MKSREQRQEEFIHKAKEIHRNESLDYSEVMYVNNRTRVKIIDHDLDENGEEYGAYWQTPSNHLRGSSHPGKRGKKITKAKAAKQDEIIERFKRAHQGENLNYSEVEYVNMHTPVKIVCHEIAPNGEEYGVFWQEPIVHLKGCSHSQLAIDKNAQKQTYTTEQFIEKCKDVHPNYDYSYVEYHGSQEKIWIVCNKTDAKGHKHGGFWAYPDALLQGKGCPKCGNHLSVGEEEIYQYLKEIVPNEEIRRRDKKTLNGMELDIYIPSKNVAIEYDGIRWHSEEFGKDRNYHLSKTDLCLKKGVYLIHVFEDEWLNDSDEIKRLFKEKLCFKEEKIEFKESAVRTDRRWLFPSDVKCLLDNGFQIVETIPPSFTYTNGHGKRVKEIPLNEEKEKYYKIWDCGEYIWKKLD